MGRINRGTGKDAFASAPFVSKANVSWALSGSVY